LISLLVAPLFYIMPLGLGLLFLRRLIGRVPAPLLFPSATLFGYVVITRVVEAAEELNVLRQTLAVVTALTIISSVVGLIGLRHWRRRFRVRLSTAVIVAAAIVPAFIYNFFILSRFPLTDLFQEVHTMKGAEELARIGVLNQLVANSYIPVKQVVNGILIKAFGYDQLVGFWGLALWTACFKILVIWAVSRLARNSQQRAIVFVLMSGLITTTEVTNGVLCALAALLLIVCLTDGARLMNAHERNSNSIRFLVTFVIASTFFWLIFAANPISHLIFLLASAWAANALSGRLRIVVGCQPAGTWKSSSSTWMINNRFLLAFILIGLMIPLHRGSLLFIPLAAFLACIWTIDVPQKFVAYVSRLGMLLPIVALCFALLAIAEYLQMLNASGRINSLMSAVASHLLGVSGSTEMNLGLGGRNATIEWLRSLAVIAVSGIGLLWIYSIGTKSGRQLWADRVFCFSWTAAWLLTCFILLGFPYAYRAMFFVGLLFAFAISVALPKALMSIEKPRWGALIVVLLMGVSYEFASIALAGIRPYRPFFDQFLLGIAGIVAVFLATMRTGERWRPIWLGALLVFAISADRLGARAAFFKHTYGLPPQKLDAISHYNVEELEFADGLRQLDPRTLIISDPYTISLIRARTGLSALAQYSNLDTVASRSEQLLRETLSYAAMGTAAGVCKGVGELLDEGGEYNYLRRRLNPSDSSVSAVIVYSARTEGWRNLAAGERISYYPTEAALQPALISRLSSVGGIEARVNDKIIAVRVSCSDRDVPAG
jgi:hypothetical protein